MTTTCCGDAKIHVADEGIVLEYEMKKCVDGRLEVLPIDTATELKVFLKDPSGTVTAHDGAFSGDGSDGKYRYVLATDDIDAAGVWYRQGKVTTPDLVVHTAVTSFEVEPNLQD